MMVMYNYSKSIALRILLFLCHVALFQVVGYACGTGSCIGGQPAVSGLHTCRFLFFRSVRSGSLESNGLNVTIGTKTIVPGTIQSFAKGTTYKINVQDKRQRMKGAFIRMSVPGVSSFNGTLVPTGLGAKVATLCPSSIRGITHVDPLPKQSFGGTIRFPNPITTNVTFDITIVFTNEIFFGGAHHAYGKYVIKIV
jgi:hypothetical protein